MQTTVDLLLAFVALYPVCTAALWIAGGLLFRLFEESRSFGVRADGDWPGVTVLIPAYNEDQVIATSVSAALAADYPELEVLVLDDGSKDETEAAALRAAGGDPRAGRGAAPPRGAGGAPRCRGARARATRGRGGR